MRLRNVAVVAALMSLSVAALAQGPRRDGNWDVKMEMVMPGMQMPAITSTQCITKEDAADPQKAMPQGGRGNMNNNCKVSDYKAEGNKVSWKMTCEGQRPMTGTGEFVYTGDTYDGAMKMDMGGQTMTMKYSGKRLGDCTK